MIIKNLYFFIFLSTLCFSCRTSKIDHRSKINKNNSIKLNKIPALSLASDELTLYEVCKSKDDCIIGFDDGSGQSLPPLDSSNKYINISRCNNNGCNFIKKIPIKNHNEFAPSNDFIEGSQNQDLSILLATKAVSDHINSLKKCSTSKDPITADLKNYVKTIFKFDKKTTAQIFLDLKAVLNRPLDGNSLPDLKSWLKPSKTTFNLTDVSISKPVYRSEVWTFQSPVKKSFWSYYKDERKNKNSIFSSLQEAFVEWRHVNGGNHAALIIQKQNKRGDWDTVRYVSWPFKNDLPYDVIDEYSATNVKKVQMPEFTEERFFDFERWFRKQPYFYWGNEDEAGELAQKRLEAKEKIGEQLKLENEIAKITKVRASKALIKKAVRANFENLDLVKKRASLKAEIKKLENKIIVANKMESREPGLTKALIENQRKLDILNKKIKTNERIITSWYEDWQPYKKASLTSTQKTQAKQLFKDYLETEIKTESYRRKISAKDYKTKLTRDLNYYSAEIRATLFMPPEVDLDKYGFNQSDPSKTLELEEIFEKYHGFDPKNPKKWKKFIEKNYDNIKRTMSDFEYWGQYDTFSYEKQAFIDDGFEEYIYKFKTDEVLDDYNKTMRELHARRTKYSKEFDITKNNCVCSVVQSLDSLYETSHFSKKRRRWTTPDQLQKVAKDFSEKKTSLSSKSRVSAGATILGTTAIIALSSLVLKDSALFLSEDENNHLNNLDRKCVEKERKRYIEKMDGIFETANTDRIAQQLMKYFIVEKMSDNN